VEKNQRELAGPVSEQKFRFAFLRWIVAFAAYQLIAETSELGRLSVEDIFQ
jgi:hypothetical protein